MTDVKSIKALIDAQEANGDIYALADTLRDCIAHPEFGLKFSLASALVMAELRDANLPPEPTNRPKIDSH